LLIGTSMGIMAFNNKHHVSYILLELRKKEFSYGGLAHANQVQ
jgi:hypothetical protein